MCECRYCGKYFYTNIQCGAHEATCKTKSQNPELYKVKEFILVCGKCGKEYTIITTQHEINKGNYKKFCSKSCANTRVHSQETKNKIRNSVYKYIDVYGNCSWNKNKNGFNNKGYKIYNCKWCGKEFTIKDNNGGRKFCCEECRQEFLKQAYKKCGGYREGSGRGKGGWYKGIYCDSSWELAFVIYNLDHNIDIKRCKERRKYIFNNKEHTYLPDFIVNDKIYEIKGYKTDRWLAKIKQNPDIIVLYKQDIKPYLDYCYNTYGSNFIETMYDNSKPVEDLNDRTWVWVTNSETRQRTMIRPNKLDEYLNNGWIRGRR